MVEVVLLLDLVSVFSLQCLTNLLTYDLNVLCPLSLLPFISQIFSLVVVSLDLGEHASEIELAIHLFLLVLPLLTLVLSDR